MDKPKYNPKMMQLFTGKAIAGTITAFKLPKNK